jgi:hypothetical protein
MNFTIKMDHVHGLVILYKLDHTFQGWIAMPSRAGRYNYVDEALC